jgi:hypothetical protein
MRARVGSWSAGRYACLVGCVVSCLVGCLGTSTYGYQYQLQQQFTGGEEPEAPQVEARQLLAGAKVVAFYPPDSCVNADPSQGAKRLQELKASCGTLMSKLERGAQAAGYEVVSWQNLRPPSSGAQRSIDYAREAKVEVLFEVNEFEVVQLDDTSVERTLRFFKLEDGQERPVAVSSQLADACRRYRGGLHQNVAWTGAIDIKTVQVVDGRDRWHYRKTEERAHNVTYPRLTFSAKKRRHPLEKLASGFGVAALLTAVDLIILQNVLTDDPTDPDDGFDPSPWQYVSIGAAAALFTGAYFARTKLAIEPEASATLCNEKLQDPDPVVLQAGTMSAQHQFTETSSNDSEAATRREISAKMIDEFIAQLKDARAQH